MSPAKASTLLDADAEPATGGGALDVAAGGAVSPTPCEEKRRYTATIFDEDVATGAAVQLKLGDPPIVIAQGRAVGELAGPEAAFPMMCLRSGYRLIGAIVALDQSQRQGEIELRGVRGSPP